MEVPQQGYCMYRCGTTGRNGLLSLSNPFHFARHACTRSVLLCNKLAQFIERVSYVQHSIVTMVMSVFLTCHTIYDTLGPRLRAMLDVLDKGQMTS